MSVPVNQRNKSKFEVLVKTRELVKYTLTIAKNEKVFTPEYQMMLTNDVVDTAKNAFIRCWTANNIRVTNAAQARQRKQLQEKAILDCNNLLALIDLSKSVYHLKNKRIKYWAENVIEVRKLIKDWSMSDTKRYNFT